MKLEEYDDRIVMAKCPINVGHMFGHMFGAKQIIFFCSWQAEDRRRTSKQRIIIVRYMSDQPYHYVFMFGTKIYGETLTMRHGYFKYIKMRLTMRIYRLNLYK